jgi:hypothetical protein
MADALFYAVISATLLLSIAAVLLAELLVRSTRTIGDRKSTDALQTLAINHPLHTEPISSNYQLPIHDLEDDFDSEDETYDRQVNNRRLGLICLR